MPTGHQEHAARAPAQSAAPATATPLDADAGPSTSEHLDGAAWALFRAEGLASGLAGDLARIFALAPSGSDPGDHDLRKDLAADAAASDASSPPDHGAEPPAIPHALMLVLSCLDDAGLRREFDAHADLAALAASAEDKGERRMSKAGLAKFMGAKGLAHGEAEVERVMKRVDTNGDFEIDFLEFCGLARANSDLELVLRSQKLECILASFFPSGTKLEDIGKMGRAQFSDIVNLSQPAMVQLLVSLAAQVAAVGTAQDGAGGSKFSGELKGGTLDDFYEGVTGVCGEPDADIEKGMREEHTMLPDSDDKFSTANYGLTTTPSKEWALVLEGGSGCAKVEGKEDSVCVTGTRGCCKASGLKWLNTGNADPTILGLKWQAVGDTQPTEGRQLTSSMLADALAPSEPPPKCPTAQHVMVISTGTYNTFGCDRCGASKSGERWCCGNCSNDFCFECEPLRMAAVVDFTKEDLDKFGITDLRSTDFIEALDGSYFKPLASPAEILANPALAEALLQKTEFTQQEWDAFGVDGLRMHHVVKSGDSFFHPAGETQLDVRVLRPITYYGDFGDDGRLRWGVGDEVVVGEAFTVAVGDYEKMELAKDTEGKVLEINAEGAAKIAFREPVSAEPWVPKDQFYRLFPLPNARDTPIQRLVMKGRLRRCEALALALYTGPMFVLYNAIMRGFGFCGAVGEGIEFKSDEFWAQWKKKDIVAWVKRSGHKFTNTIHALASAVKKLQGLAAEEPSTHLYRGLGGLSVAAFAASCGFTDKAFMSTTMSREIALEYSGVKTAGTVGTVLCIETSTTNKGGRISKFSQYPAEEETVWNACSFLQHLPGRDEVVLPPGGGVVRIYHVLVSANSRAQTVEELEGRRKRVVVQVLNTLHADVCRAVDAAAKTAEFKARVSQDYRDYKDRFIDSIKNESAARVAVYKALPDGAYAEIEVVGQAVSKGLALPLLTNAKLRLWLEDTSLDLYTMGSKGLPSYLGLDAAQGRRLAQRRLLLLDSSASGRRGSTDRVGRIVVEDGLGRMGGTEAAALALEDCRERRLVTGAGAAALERRDQFSGETALIAQVQLGEYENAKRLLQAGADPNAATAGGERALLIAAKAGREDLVELIAGFKADVNVSDALGKTALHFMSEQGKIPVVQVLVKVGANVEAKDKDGRTSLHDASENGHAAVVQTLLQHGADVAAIYDRGRTSLHYASENGHAAVVQALLKHVGAVAATNEDGRTALDFAECCRDEVKKEEVKAALREHGAKHSLFYAAEKGMVDLVADLIKEGANVNEKDHNGWTSLHYASKFEHAAVVQTLLQHGADVAARTELENTSLHVASRNGHAAVVQTLLQHGADVAASNVDGDTALDRAENCDDEVKKEEVKAALREHGAKHSLCYAARKGMVDLVADLIKEGANVNEKGYDGWTSLHAASQNGHAAVVQTLLQHGADVAARNKGGETALDCAEKCNDEVKKEEVKALLAAAF